MLTSSGKSLALGMAIIAATGPVGMHVCGRQLAWTVVMASPEQPGRS